MDPLDLQGEIEEIIRATVADTPVRVFWPDQFVDAHLGTYAEVLDALRALVVSGKLVARVRVACQHGHDRWEGSPEAFRRLQTLDCHDCNEPIEDLESQAVVYFQLSDRLLQAVENQKKKKRSLDAAY